MIGLYDICSGAGEDAAYASDWTWDRPKEVSV